MTWIRIKLLNLDYNSYINLEIWNGICMCVTLLLFRIKPFVIRNDKSRPIHIANDENVKCKRKRMVRSFQCLTLQAMSCHYLKDRDRERKKWRNRQEKEYNNENKSRAFHRFQCCWKIWVPWDFTRYSITFEMHFAVHFPWMHLSVVLISFLLLLLPLQLLRFGEWFGRFLHRFLLSESRNLM